MQITVVYDPSVNASNFSNYAADGFSSGAAEEAAFKNAISYVVHLYDALFTNNVSFTIDVGWGEDGQKTSANPSGSATGNAIPSNAVAANLPFNWPVGVGPLSYSQVVTALKANEGGQQATIEANAYNALPATDPLPNPNLYLSVEEAEMLGIASFNGAGDDVGFATTPNGGSWYFGTGTPKSSQTDFIAAAEHEISEGMGRLSFVGTQGGQESILDLFRYTASGVRDLTTVPSGQGNTAYFSLNGGVTSGGTWNNDVLNTLYSPPGSYDLGDWAPGQGPGPGGQDAYGQGNNGTSLPLTLSDTTVMNALGWNLSFASNTIPNGVTGWVPAGQTATRFIVQSGGTQDVGGISDLTTASSGGIASVFAGGTADSTIVDDGGSLVVQAGGTASGTFVSGGTDTVYGAEISATVDGGVTNGLEIVSSGGASTGTRLNSGGVEEVYSAGITSGTTIYQGGHESVNGGIARDTILSGGAENVYSGGSAVSASLVLGAQTVYSGGTAIDTKVGSTGAEWLGDGAILGGTASSTTVSSGGFQYVQRGGTASKTTIDSGGSQWIYAGGKALSATVDGEQDVYSGGSAGHTTIKSGGIENVSSGGTDSGATVDSGGKQIVFGLAVSTTIDTGGFQWISSGGEATSATADGGHQDIFAGGSATGGVITSSGIQNVNSGGAATSALIESGGHQNVFAAGTASGSVLSGGGVQNVDSGGAVVDILFRAGTQNVLSGAVVSGMNVANGTQNISSGGATVSTFLSGGSLQVVSAGGTASATTIAGHSVQSDQGVAIGTVVSDGYEYTYGAASGSIIMGSGNEYVEQGAVASDTIIRGGMLEILSGGTMEGSTTVSGGTLQLQATAVTDGPIIFSGGGTLQIDGTTMPSATISGLADDDVIDLAGVAFDPSGGATVVAGNVLQITQDGATYDLQLDPGTDYSGATFTVFGESQPGAFVVLGAGPATGGETVGAGMTVSNLVIVAGGTLTVLPGGTASGVVIDSGGIVYVSSGGAADGTIVNDGGNQVVLSGGTASGTVLKDPGLETISAGGVSIDAMLDGGEQYVSSGGTASGATVGSASDQYVYAGGTANNTTVDGGVQVVYGTADGTTLSGTFATQFVYGSAIATTIGFESYEYVETGGTDSGTIVGSAGLDFVSSGGVTSGSEVMSGGNQYVYGSANATMVDDGGVQNVQSGGVALDTLIDGTGDQFVYAGGIAANTTVDGGVQVVYGAASSTTINGSFATQFVYGTASATTIGFESYEYVETGGADVGTIVAYGGLDYVSSGGATSGSEVMSGGNQYIYGSAIGTTVDTTGVQAVESGGAATGTAVASDGFQYVSAAGVAEDTMVNGGEQVVYGTASDTTVSGSFATQFVYGSATGTTIGAFSFEYVETGGFDTGTVVGNDGQHFIYAGGITIGAEIQSGGDEEVYGSATGTTVDTGGDQNVDSGGTAIGTQVGNAGVMYVSAGGTASGTIVDGGDQAVYGTAVDTTVTGSFGTQFVYGSATGTTIGSGSYDYVEAGGADSGTFVSSGGLDLIYAGGTTVGTAIAGGEQDVLGSAIGTTVDGMGLVHVYAGGTTQGATINSGSVERVDSGGTADGSTIAGGSLRLADGASLGGTPVTFGGPGGTLAIGGAAMPGNAIDGFETGDAIDLTDVGYDSSGTAVLEAGNVLQVLEGGQTYDLDFDPSQNFIGYGFALSTDSSSGTDITLVQQPISSAGAVSAGEMVSGVSVTSGGSLDVLPGGTAIVGTVSSGGTMNVSSGASADGVTIADGGYQYVLSGGTASNTIATDPGVQVISAGGSSIDATLDDGEQDVYGTASGTVVGSGGLEVVFSGGTDSGTAINGGGSEVVSTGGTAIDTLVDSGGVLQVLDGGALAGYIVNDGTVDFDLTGSAGFGGTLVGVGNLEVSGGGTLDVTSTYIGSSQIDDSSTLEFNSTYLGVATFSGSSVGPGGTLAFDAGSVGPINVVNPSDTVIAQPGSDNWIDSTVSYTLPSNVDALFLFAGTRGAGNSDVAGDALYALDAGNAQTLIGDSLNDTFVVYNSSDVVVPGAGSEDAVYAAVSYTLPAGVDTLILEAGTQAVGNSDAAGDALYAANPGQLATLVGNSQNDTFAVYNSSDVVVPQAGSHDVVYAAVSYTLPTGVDTLILEAGTQAVGNSDAAGDALYAANPNQAATLIGNSANDTFVVYNSADVVVPQAGSHDIVYSAVNYTLPTGVDSLILESGTQAVGNSDAAGDTLYAANAGIAQTLTGNSANDIFVVYNSADTVIGQAGSTDTVYAAADFTLPANVDTLFVEGTASLGTGNDDAVDALFGNAGVASTLVAGSGADILTVTGTAGTTLMGGAGADTFAFPNAMGNDEVTNFNTAKDALQFNASLFANFSAAMGAATQVGAATVFTIDANNSVTLDNVSRSSLTANNFHFS